MDKEKKKFAPKFYKVALQTSYIYSLINCPIKMICPHIYFVSWVAIFFLVADHVPSRETKFCNLQHPKSNLWLCLMMTEFKIP